MGWADNFTTFQSVLQNIPSNLKNETYSFLCLNDEKVFEGNEDTCAVTDFNLTGAQYYSLARGLTPVVVISNFTAQETPMNPLNVGSPLNGIVSCQENVTVNALYEDGNLAPTWNGGNPTDQLLKWPNASSVRNLSIVCDMASHSPWMWDCTEPQSSSHRIDVPILLVLLLASMSMFFANVLL